MNISTSGIAVPSGDLFKLRLMGGGDPSSAEKIDGHLLEAASVREVAGPGIGWAIRAASEPLKDGKGIQSLEKLHLWVEAIRGAEVVAQETLSTKPELPADVVAIMEQAESASSPFEKEKLTVKAALAAADHGDWNSFAWIATARVSSDSIERLAGEAVHAFLKAGDLSSAAFLSDMLIGSGDASGRAVAILTRQIELGLFSSNSIDEVLDRSRAILRADDRFRLLGDAFFLLTKMELHSDAARIRTALCSDIEDCATEKVTICSPGVVLGVVTMLSRGISSGCEAAAFALYDDLALPPSTRSHIAENLLTERVQYNRLTFSSAGVARLYSDVLFEAKENAEGERARFSQALFRARVKGALGEPYADELETAHTLAEGCRWAHSKFIASTRDTALKEVTDVAVVLGTRGP